MDVVKTSPGYRFPDPSSRSSVSLNRHSAGKSRSAAELRAPDRRDPDLRDPVKQDQAWREFVRAERHSVKEWHKNWAFLTDFDQLGRPRKETPLPAHVSVFSDRVPNTANQALGSRVGTELGCELLRLERLVLLSSGHRKVRPDPELQPC
ncbi:hypothetical protein Z043_113351 [Scleropages formosus]|uniref:Ciliary microtubule inner protein 5 n=1 Tax=Scleropages formosus TaxID=113540 RepID=A0A0P7WV90_SCLFO|nr:uncharacterized protein C2orf50 homolog [Scleropages formosus]KPP68003.1 hypothetical protein Z043_113351 [Scleropages formosus]